MGNPCDEICGGAGCGRCGGSSCENGALQRSKLALELSKKAEEKIDALEMKAGRMLEEVGMDILTLLKNHPTKGAHCVNPAFIFPKVLKAQQKSKQAHQMTELAESQAVNAKNISRDLTADLNKLLAEINEFTTGDRAKSSQIRKLAEDIKGRSISLSQDEIMNLATQINQTISGLTNIDNIIQDSAADARIAESVKQRAIQARYLCKSNGKRFKFYLINLWIWNFFSFSIEKSL